MEIQENISLKEYSSFKVGGSARYFLLAENKEDIISAIQEIKLPFYIIGGASNILFPDKGLNALVIKINNNEFEIIDNDIQVGAGISTAVFLQKCVESNLSGAEFLAGIPGTIGGAINSNAGAFKNSMQDIIEEVLVLNSENLETRILKNSECNFSYRDSLFKNKNNLIILSCKIKLKKENKEKILQQIKINLETRKENQPYEFPSAGSIFKNPKDYSAGQLIEEVGLKGFKINGAEVSTKHANFIINKGDASSEDIKEIIKIIKEKVKEKFNIELEEEIKVF